jgi:hypothetical protein
LKKNFEGGLRAILIQEKHTTDSEEAKRRGIQNNHTLAIYLTPERKAATDPAFISLASGVLVKSMREAIHAEQGASDEIRHLVYAFLTTYGWLN